MEIFVTVLDYLLKAFIASPFHFCAMFFLFLAFIVLIYFIHSVNQLSKAQATKVYLSMVDSVKVAFRSKKVGFKENKPQDEKQ